MNPPIPKRGAVLRINALSYGLLVYEMMAGNKTAAQLAEVTGLHIRTVRQYTLGLHRAGACYITGYVKGERGRDTAPLYMIGLGVDVKRQKMTPAERSARYRAKQADAATPKPKSFIRIKNIRQTIRENRMYLS